MTLNEMILKLARVGGHNYEIAELLQECNIYKDDFTILDLLELAFNCPLDKLFVHNFGEYDEGHIYITRSPQDNKYYVSLLGYESRNGYDEFQLCRTFKDLAEMILRMKSAVREFQTKESLIDWLNNLPELPLYKAELMSIKSEIMETLREEEMSNDENIKYYYHSIQYILAEGIYGATRWLIPVGACRKSVEQSDLFEFTKQNKDSIIISSNIIEISKEHFDYLKERAERVGTYSENH